MINAGIAGLGKWGQALVSSVQGKSNKINFTAGCTGRKARAQAYCDANGIDLRDDLEALLTDDSLDAIVLATPHSQHADQVVQAAAAGKQIFIEKPFTLTRVDALRAVKAADKAGVVLALGHNRRFHPALQKITKLVKTGALGTILHVEGNLSSPGGQAYTKEHWRAGPDESPAGGMCGMGIHIVDAMISLMGPITEVTARSERQVLEVDLDDTTAMLLRFKSGASGYLGTLTATPLIWRLQVFGTKGWAEMFNYDRLTIHTKADGLQVTEIPPFDMERAELEAFADACSGGPAYPLPWEDAINGVAALEAIITSANAGEKPTAVEL